MAEKCDIIDGKRRRYRVEVFVLGDNNTILASLKGLGNYPELPGGGLDEGESLTEAGLRETREEAGWSAIAPTVLDVPGNWLFAGSDDAWFNRCGWNEEQQLAVVCTADMFAPTHEYGSEGDSHEFDLVPIPELIAHTEEMLKNELTPRRRFLALFRLAALKRISERTLVIESYPNWKKW